MTVSRSPSSVSIPYDPPPLVPRRRRDVARREHALDERVDVQLLPVRRVEALHRSEADGLGGEHLAPVDLDRVRHAELTAAVPADQARQLGHPWLTHVALVPDQAEPAARNEHPRQLGRRPRDVEPVEGLGDGHGVHRLVGERQRLGGAVEGVDVRHGAGELGSHRRRRLDRGDRGAGRLEQPRQLAGAGGEVDDVPIGADPELLDEPRHGVGRVGRPAALVHRHVGAEPRGCGLGHPAVERVAHRPVTPTRWTRRRDACAPARGRASRPSPGDGSSRPLRRAGSRPWSRR